LKSLFVSSVQTRSFRNLADQEVVLGPRFNVLAGDNGQGKTNFLEALYVSLTSKSFRTHKLAELVSHARSDDDADDHAEPPVASVKAAVNEDTERRVQVVGFRAGMRQAKIDDKRPPSLADFAVRSPVVVFHPRELELSMGGSAERRKLLDRVALYLAPAALDAHARYTQAMRSRQRALEVRGADAAELDAFETLMAEHGHALMEHRRRACELVGARAKEVFSAIGTPGLSLAVEYAPGAALEQEAFVDQLAQNRVRDSHRGSASKGPHRDDVRVLIGGHAARTDASQGQHRAIVLALKAAEIDVVAQSRDVRPILLLDDVSSELDRDRTTSLFAFLRDQRGQVVLTTTRPELIDVGKGDERVDYSVCGGLIKNATSA
jgi:DNA replication and repair protein RecF